MTAAEAIAQIEQIDRLYDGVLTALQMRLRHNLSVTGFGLSCMAWHRAWQRCPDLEIRRDALMLQRGRLQLVRDAAIHREWLAEQRSQKAHEAAQRRRDAADRARRNHTTALAA